MAAYTTFLSAPPSVGNFLVGDTMMCPVTAPVQFWTYCGGGVWAPTPTIIKRFPAWPVNGGLLLPTLVAGATASRTGDIVTVVATGHTVPSGTAYVGYRIYYAGSTNLVAGWYDSILTVPDANTITFFAPGPDFTSESINSGAAWVTATDLVTANLEGNTLKDQSKVKVYVNRASSLASITKSMFVTFGGSPVVNHSLTTSPRGEFGLVFRCLGPNQQVGNSSGAEGERAAASNYIIYKDITQPQVLTLRGQVATAPDYLAVMGAHLEITQ